MAPDPGKGAPARGGCRSLVTGGCLLGMGAVLLAILAVIAALVLLVRLAVLAWSYL